MRVSVVYDDVLQPGHLKAARGARLAALLRACGDQLAVPARRGLVVRMTTDAELHVLNRRFLDTDAPTDVLAFPGEGDHVGDIAISVERALAQDGTPELQLLAVHGLLHCLGHDHADAGDAARMTAETRRLLPDRVVPDLVPHGEGS